MKTKSSLYRAAPASSDATTAKSLQGRRVKPSAAAKSAALPASLSGQDALIRLNKFISLCGAASRRKADELIQQGEVIVNGKVVTELGTKINRYKDEVIVAGRRIQEPKRKLYILLNKPKDTITTNRDERHRRTVLDVLGIDERVYPVGRLDRNTVGALLLTNDGELANRLMHPSHRIQKEYLATLEQKFQRADLPKLTGGMRLKDTGEKVSPCEAKILGDGSVVWLRLSEGKNRQVHRMFWSLGYEVKKLERIRYAGLSIEGLRRGEWRHLSAAEIAYLRAQCGLAEK
ncbi:MAG: pseudouridine synthase [Chloroherpetonaceae bacterium]|nr:pseudouridine synthase [Chloroherpetonaceae bacterium]